MWPRTQSLVAALRAPGTVPQVAPLAASGPHNWQAVRPESGVIDAVKSSVAPYGNAVEGNLPWATLGRFFYPIRGEAMTGKIKMLNMDRGFGFVTADSGDEFFLHQSEMTNRDFDLLFPGSIVEFEGVPTGKGLRATRVVRR